MGLAVLAVGCAAAVLAVAALVAAVVHLRRELAGSRAALAELRTRLEKLAEDVDASRTAAAAAPVVPEAEYVITTAGAGSEEAPQAARSGAVLAVTLGEPLLKVLALGYGVRSALSAESRNRIAFHMRQEDKRARKERRRRLREARRAAQTAPPRSGRPEAAA